MEKIIKNKIVFMTGLIYFIIMLGVLTLKMLVMNNVIEGGYVASLVCQIGLMFLVPLLLYPLLCKKNFKQTFEQFAFRKISWKAVLYSVLAGICLFILITYISSLWSGLLSLFGYEYNSSSAGDYSVLSFILAILFTGILPGFCEEFTHRGLVLGGMRKNGSLRACLLCGLLFGLMHFNVVQFGYAWVAGTIFCFVTLLSRSIFPAMIMHFTNNTITVLINYSENSAWMGNSIVDNVMSFFTTGNNFILAIFNLLLIMLAIYVLFKCVTKLFLEGKRGEFLKFKKNLENELKDTDLTEDIDVQDNKQVLEIYQQTNMLSLQQKLEKGEITLKDLAGKADGKRATELLLSNDFSLPEKKHILDYLFYYCAFILGSVGLIFSFLLGI